MKGNHEAPLDRGKILLGVSAAAFLGPFTQTVYTPSLVEIGGFFHANTLLVNFTISVYTAILAISSFIVGPLADAHGRRKVLLPGLLAYVVGSLLCLLATSYDAFLVGRVIQAGGISTGSVIAAAVIGDIYPPKERPHAMSVFQLVVFLGPVVGPVIGGLIAGYLHWQWAFAVLIAAGAGVILYNVRLLPETLAANGSGNRLTLAGIRSVVANRSARSILLIGFSQFYGYYLFLVFLPQLSSVQFSLPPAQRGFLFVPLTAGILCGITGAKRWLGHWPGTRIVRVASYGAAATAFAMWLLLATGLLTIPLLIGVLLAYGLLIGGSIPAQSTILVNLFSSERATAMGIYGFCRFMGAAAGPMLGALIAGAFGNPAMMMSLGVLLLIAAWIIQRSVYDPHEEPAAQPERSRA